MPTIHYNYAQIMSANQSSHIDNYTSPEIHTKRMLVHTVILIVHTIVLILLFTTDIGKHVNYSYAYYYDEDDTPVTQNKVGNDYSDSKLTYKPFLKKDRLLYKSLAKNMFYHGYNSYMKYAYPLDELNPIDCTGRGPDTEHP